MWFCFVNSLINVFGMIRLDIRWSCQNIGKVRVEYTYICCQVPYPVILVIKFIS